MTVAIDVQAYLDRFEARMADERSKFNAAFPHRVEIEQSVDWAFDHEFTEQMRWCHSNCTGRYHLKTAFGLGRGLASMNVGIFSFASDRDAILFKMFWQEGE